MLPLGPAELRGGRRRAGGKSWGRQPGEAGEEVSLLLSQGEQGLLALCSGMEKCDCLWALDGEKGSGWLLWGRRTPCHHFSAVGCSEQVGRRHGRCFVVCLAVSLGVLPTKLCLNPI